MKPPWARRADLYAESDLARELMHTRRRNIADWVAEEAAQFLRSTPGGPVATFGEFPVLSDAEEADWARTICGWDPDAIDWGTAEPAVDTCPELTEILQLGYRAGRRCHGDRYLDGLVKLLRSSFEQGANEGCGDDA